MQKITARSRLLSRGSVDGRSREGRFLAAYRARLHEHLGGDPSPTQAMLIRQLAVLALRLQLMDEHAGPTGVFSTADSQRYLAWSNSLVRGLAALGLDKRPVRKLTPEEYLAQRAAARR